MREVRMKHQYIPTAIQSGAFGKPTLISKLDSFISFLVIQLIKRGGICGDGASDDIMDDNVWQS